MIWISHSDVDATDQLTKPPAGRFRPCLIAHHVETEPSQSSESNGCFDVMSHWEPFSGLDSPKDFFLSFFIMVYQCLSCPITRPMPDTELSSQQTSILVELHEAFVFLRCTRVCVAKVFGTRQGKAWGLLVKSCRLSYCKPIPNSRPLQSNLGTIYCRFSTNMFRIRGRLLQLRMQDSSQFLIWHQDWFLASQILFRREGSRLSINWSQLQHTQRNVQETFHPWFPISTKKTSNMCFLLTILSCWSLARAFSPQRSPHLVSQNTGWLLSGDTWWHRPKATRPSKTCFGRRWTQIAKTSRKKTTGKTTVYKPRTHLVRHSVDATVAFRNRAGCVSWAALFWTFWRHIFWFCFLKKYFKCLGAKGHAEGIEAAQLLGEVIWRIVSKSEKTSAICELPTWDT